MTAPASLVGAALSAVLSAGVTAAAFRLAEPDVVPIEGERLLAPELRHVASRLVVPEAPFRPVSAGRAVDVADVEGLADLGFARGWTRTFSAPDGRKVDAFVLEFGDGAGARAFAQNLGRAARLLADPRPFTVTGVPGSSGLADATRNRDGTYVQVVATHRGARAALLVYAANDATPGADLLALAQRQWALLAN